MKAIYLLEAAWDYEGSIPLRAFADKADADQAAEACRLYQATRPAWTESSADEEEISQWHAADDAWQAAHPGGEDAYSADSFIVVEVPFSATAAPPEEKE